MRHLSALGRLPGILLAVGLVLLLGRPALGVLLPVPPVREASQAAGIPGGLCVLVGCGSDDNTAAALARTGRYLVHQLEPSPATIAALRRHLHEAQLYGLASVDQLDPAGKLPYTENLVNVLVLGEGAGGTGGVTLAEAARVLRPDGVLLTSRPLVAADLAAVGLEPAPTLLPATSPWNVARKPWPKEMDQWTHSRHAADGNAVSHDTLAGLPQRVRWVTGPQQEVSNFVAAGGRAFFGGVLARDGFNGLRLWEQKLTPSPARGGFGVVLGSAVQPIATPGALLALHDGAVQAFDAATGTVLRTYPDAGIPTELMLEGSVVLALDRDTIRALDLDTAKLLWTQGAPKLHAVAAGDGTVYCVQGDPLRATGVMLVARSLATGQIQWQKDYPWLAKVRRCTYHRLAGGDSSGGGGAYLGCEISTLTDDKPGNVLQMVAARDGASLWGREYLPGATHKQQARALFVGDLVWVLEAKRCIGLDPRTGEVKQTLPAGSTHCFPPVATERYFIGGEMDFTDFATGELRANQITKQACSRDAGVVPANGLLYTFPKHCICWPMLRDYAALAPARPGGMPDLDALRFTPEPGPAAPPQATATDDSAPDWPCYRHDAQRSGSTLAAIPRDLRILWTTSLGDRAATGPIADDWRGNFFVRGPVGPPVAAGGLVCVTRPDAHQVVALDAATGQPRWAFTAAGRVDTAPTLHRGLCLFGSASGYVYCLRAADGAVVWRLRAAPLDERIIAYGQLESPWPVPGSVLVADGVAYFAAGRQPLADGGILLFAVTPETGAVRWVHRLDHVPQTNFYNSSGLEFDNFDLLQLQGNAIAMSRWLFDRATGAMTVQAKSGFAELPSADGANVLVPRGTWSYAPRNETEHWSERPYVRPLTVFRGSTLYGCAQDRRSLYRRDFHLAVGEKFDTDWFAGWSTYDGARKGGDLWQSQRLAHAAAWAVNPFDPLTGKSKETIAGLVLAGPTLCVAGHRGRVCVLDAATGAALSELDVAPPAWDGLAAAGGRVLLTTQDGRVVCLGQ